VQLILVLWFADVSAIYFAVRYPEGESAFADRHSIRECKIDSMTHTAPIEIFFSYSHKDEELLNKLLEHLANLEWQRMIKPWTDRKIDAGQEWADKIDEHLNTSKIILLLVSPSFMKSRYCYDVEVRRAMDRHAAQEACVIPVILRPCDWKDTPFEKIQALPLNAMPVTKWEDQDDAFLDIANGIRKVVEGIRKDGKVTPLPSPDEDQGLPAVQPLVPYLCDRDMQIAELESALEKQRAEMEQKDRHPRPVVCVIHGESDEDPEWFQVRLKEKSLPNYFRLDRRQKSVQDFALLLKPDDATRDDLAKVLQKHLAMMMSNKGLISKPQATKQEMLEALAALRMPVMIHSHLNAEGWEQRGRKLTEAFLQFWNSWPEFPPSLTLISCLIIKYGKLENAGLFQRWKYERANNKARRFLKEELTLSTYGNMHGVLLPELTAISQAQVQNWIDDGSNFEQLCVKHKLQFCSPPDAITRIARFYNQSPLRRMEGNIPVIPMNPLATELLDLLDDTRTRCKRGLL
jgi:hypothetical protein